MSESNSVDNTQVSTTSSPKVTPKAPIPMNKWLPPSPSHSVSSASRRICRICQMEAGEMVRPCDCAGTMGDVHEECLTKWVNISKKKKCEICHSDYAKSGVEFKPFAQWEAPKINGKVFFSIFLIAVLIFLIFYMVALLYERRFGERIFSAKMQSRPDDFGRISIIVILNLALINNLFLALSNGLGYLRKQRQIRFVNKHVI